MANLPFKVKALYEYTSQHDDDLDFSAGQIITVTEEEDDDWYVGEYTSADGEGRQGIFPKNFVEKYEPELPPRPSRPARTKQAAPAAAPAAPQPDVTESQQEPETANKPSATVGTSSLQQTPDPVLSPEPVTTEEPMPKPDDPTAVPIVATSSAAPATVQPKPKPLAKGPPPVVSEKPSSFKDRIAAFNKPAAPPIAPIKPGGAASSGGSFIKKPFVAPPPSKDAFVPTVRDRAPQTVYRREEDPEIAERIAQDRENAERAGLAGADVPSDETEEAPKPTSLKDRIALLQKQQLEQASRRSEASQKEKPKKPPKKRTSSHEQAEERPLERVGSGENEARSSGDVPRESSVGRQQPIPEDEPSRDRETFSDANDADQSAAGETTEDTGHSTGHEDDGAGVVRPTAHQTEIGAQSSEARGHFETGDANTEVVDDGQDEEEEEEEDEIDEETRRKLELRERMAKMSGGMGMAGMFGAPQGLPSMVTGTKKKSLGSSSKSGPEAPPVPPITSSPESAPPVPMVPVPGMARMPTGPADDGEDHSAASATMTPAQNSSLSEVSAQQSRAPPPVPRDRPLPARPGSSGREPPAPSVPASTPAPPARQSRPVPPPPPAEQVRSPSPGSESDDEMPDRSTEAAAPAPDDQTPGSVNTRGSSYFAVEKPTVASSPSMSDRRSSRPIPPVPGNAPATPGSRPPPPPPPTAAPPPRQHSTSGTTTQMSNADEVEGESEYEGDYDTDIASGAPHKDALGASTREDSLDSSAITDESTPAPSKPPIPGPATRAAPMPPPHVAPPRKSVDGPRAPPPPVPVSREVQGASEDEEYDPYRYGNMAASRAPPAIPTSLPPEPLDREQFPAEDFSPPMPSRKSTDRSVQRPPPQAPPTGPAPSMPTVVPDLPSAAPPQPVKANIRQSLDVDRQLNATRRSTDAPRASGDQMYIANDVNLGQSSGWWSLENTPPPVFQGRKDILFEIEESSTSKRGGKMTTSKDVYVLFQDYSQTIVTARFDPRDPSDVVLEQRHEPPPTRPRQDQLEEAHARFGQRIADEMASRQNTTVGDGTPQGLVHESLRPFQSALLPVGTRAYGALVYANLANATVQQFDEIRAGDIMTIRNAKFQGKHGAMHAKYSMEVGKPDHVAVVVDWDGTKKKVRAWEQGRESKKVKVESFRVGDLKSGEVRVWRVMARGWVGWDDGNAA